MILIVGASGAVGVPLIKELVSRGAMVRALTSNADSAEKLTALGVAETVIGDFRVDADVAKAMSGAVSVCHIPARFRADEFEVGKRVIDAAKREAVEHFCFSSAFQPQLEDLGHHWQKLRLEEYLIGSDLMATVVQPSMFMQNVRVEWPQIVSKGVYARPYSPDSRMNAIDTKDLGEAMANIMTDNKLRGATYQLCGAGTISHREMAAIIGEELGRPVNAVQRDIEEWQAWATARGWTEYAMENYTRMCAHYDHHGYKFGNAVTLEALLGRPATDYRTFIRRFVLEQTG